MDARILIVADLGRSKVFRLEETTGNAQQRIRLLDEHDSAVTHHLSEEVTDRFGQFRRGSGPGSAHTQSDGQEHQLSQERRRRGLKELASRISEWIRQQRPEGWYLAAPREINSSLLDMLDKAVREKLERNVLLNLTNLNQKEILSHFPADTSMTTDAYASASDGSTATADRPRRRNNNPMRKPAVRRTSPLKQSMRKQKISPQLEQVMAKHKEKGDRRRTSAQRELNERSSAAAPRSARLLNRSKS